MDRYTFYALEFLESVKPGSSKTLGQFVRSRFFLIECFVVCCDIFSDWLYYILLSDATHFMIRCFMLCYICFL